MLKPSYTELMDILNKDTDLDSKITSRYTIVIAAAKRARQIIEGATYDPTGLTTDKAVSIAVSELSRGLIKITPENELEDMAVPAKSEDKHYNSSMSTDMGMGTSFKMDGTESMDEDFGDSNGDSDEE